jgi:hypothetical protein
MFSRWKQKNEANGMTQWMQNSVHSSNSTASMSFPLLRLEITKLSLAPALRKKRRPNGSLIKYKAGLCLRGDQMREGLTGDASADEQDSNSPVVNWATIRMMLTVSVKYGLQATQVDFNNAFVQAPLKEPMYMSLPPGFDQQTGHCLRLTKSLYSPPSSSMNCYTTP